MLRDHFPNLILLYQKESYLKVNVFSNFQTGYRKSYKSTYEVNGFMSQFDVPLDLLHTKGSFFIPVTQNSPKLSRVSPA